MHDHDHGSEGDKLRIVLPHLLKHNREHIKDIQKWLRLSEEAGDKGITDDLKRVVELFEEINRHLESAIEKSGT
jgi:hypothetical protein